MSNREWRFYLDDIPALITELQHISKKLNAERNL